MNQVNPNFPDLAARMTQLDGLRAIAVFAVMWHHWAPAPLRFGLPWGSGVQLFFVLSGFLITGILLDNREALEGRGDRRWRGGVFKAFYARRALRIFPIYYIVLLTAAAFGLSSLPDTLPWHALYLSNFSFYVEPGYGTSIGHWWTLAVEEQFYLFWPFVILLASRKHLLWIFVVLVLIGPAYRLYGGLFSSIPHFYIGTPGSFDSLSLGALAAYGMRYSNPITRVLFRFEFLWAAASLLLVGLIRMGVIPDTGLTLELFCLSVIYVVIIRRAAIDATGPFQHVFNNGFLRFIGLISYGLYLMHNFAGYPTMWLLDQFPWLGNIPASVIVLNFILTMAAASLSWFLIEKPLNNLKRFFPYRARTPGRV